MKPNLFIRLVALGLAASLAAEPALGQLRTQDSELRNISEPCVLSSELVVYGSQALALSPESIPSRFFVIVARMTAGLIILAGLLPSLVAQRPADRDFASLMQKPGGIEEALRNSEQDGDYEGDFSKYLATATSGRSAIDEASLRILRVTDNARVAVRLIDGLLSRALEDLKRDPNADPVLHATTLSGVILSFTGQSGDKFEAVLRETKNKWNGVDARQAQFLEVFLNLAEPGVAHHVAPAKIPAPVPRPLVSEPMPIPQWSTRPSGSASNNDVDYVSLPLLLAILAGLGYFVIRVLRLRPDDLREPPVKVYDVIGKGLPLARPRMPLLPRDFWSLFVGRLKRFPSWLRGLRAWRLPRLPRVRVVYRRPAKKPAAAPAAANTPRLRLPRAASKNLTAERLPGGWEATPELNPHYPQLKIREDKIVSQVEQFLKERAEKELVVITELCAGKGRLFMRLIQLPRVGHAVAVDLNRDSLGTLKDRLMRHEHEARIQIIEGDLNDSRVKAQIPQSDVIVIMDGLMHVPDVESALDFVATRLAPEGLFIGNFGALEGIRQRHPYAWPIVLVVLRYVFPFLTKPRLRWIGNMLSQFRPLRFITFGVYQEEALQMLASRFDVKDLQFFVPYATHQFLARSIKIEGSGREAAGPASSLAAPTLERPPDMGLEGSS